MSVKLTSLKKHSKEIKDFKDIKDSIDKDNDKILIEFLNYNSGGYLGQPIINDGDVFAKNLKKLGYKCFFICNTTAKNAKDILSNLISLEGKTIAFFYSGHGTYTADYDGDEIDGKDEAFVFKNSYFVDDDFADIINEKLKCKQLIALTDSCHSGTVWDLETIKPNLKEKLTCISSCLDNQTSVQLDKNGMFTIFFWQCYDDDSKVLNVKKLNSRLDNFGQKITIHAKDNIIDF